MGTPVQPKTIYTPQEYYALERDAAYKSEYYEGEIFDMSGGTWQHSKITTNILTAIDRRLANWPCSTFESNLRLKVKATGLRTYPDVSVYWAALELDPDDPEGTTATNPTLVVEVLSKRTEAYDRGQKSDHYRQVESLQAYALVSQWAAHVELYVRRPDGTWVLRVTKGLDATVPIEVIGVDLPLAEVYARVTFPPKMTLTE